VELARLAAGSARINRISHAHASPAGPEFTVRVAEEDAASVVNDYDSFAEAYTKQNESSLINPYYCRPAILNLAGEVAGRRILHAGCGSGPLSESLQSRGAVVSGFDSSAKMLELARQRLGPDPDLRQTDLSSPLPYPDGAFDDAIACLILHYLEDWTAPLAELRRVLKPGGRLIVAVDHPFAIALMQREAGRKPDYFATSNWTEEWTISGHVAQMSFWTRRISPRPCWPSCSSSCRPTDCRSREPA